MRCFVGGDVFWRVVFVEEGRCWERDDVLFQELMYHILFPFRSTLVPLLWGKSNNSSWNDTHFGAGDILAETHLAQTTR